MPAGLCTESTLKKMQSVDEIMLHASLSIRTEMMLRLCHVAHAERSNDRLNSISPVLRNIPCDIILAIDCSLCNEFV